MSLLSKLTIDSPRKRYRVRIRILLIVIGAIAAYIMTILLEEKSYFLASIPFTLLLIISLAEFVVADILTDNLFPQETEKLLEKLQKKLVKCEASIDSILKETISEIQNPTNSQISATFHLRIDVFGNVFFDKTESALVQIINYQGKGGGKRWRITPASKGIIGRCLRTEEPEQVYFQDLVEFNTRMKKEFGFTKQEIETISNEARSYLAHPVIHKNYMVGVLYFYSTHYQTFQDFIDTNNIISKTASNIANFLDGADII